MSEKSRLLIVSGSYPNISCGVSRHVDIIASRTATYNQYDIHVLTSRDPAIDMNLATSYTVHPLVDKWTLSCANHIVNQILDLSPDIVHIQNPTIKYFKWQSILMSLVGPKLKRRSPKTQLVVMQHDIAISNPRLRWRYKPLLKSADSIVVSNQRDYQAVIHQGINKDKVYIAPVSSHMPIPAKTPERQEQARKQFNIDPDSLCIAYFGYIHPGRNIHTLIESINILKNEGKNVSAIILGGPFHGANEYYNHCQKLAEQHGLNQQIQWTGYASEQQIADGLSAADVFVSLLERGADLRNTSIISALLAGLPVITTRNDRYYYDTNLDKFSCTSIDDITPTRLAETIIKVNQTAQSEETVQYQRTYLDPSEIWKKHVEVNMQAYRGDKPAPC